MPHFEEAKKAAEEMRSETKHTPAPWSVDEPHQIYSTAICDYVALTCKETDNGIPIPFEANARLIAAAPEMLAFIESLTDALGPYPFLDKTQVVVDARAIISKATGAA